MSKKRKRKSVHVIIPQSFIDGVGCMGTMIDAGQLIVELEARRRGMLLLLDNVKKEIKKAGKADEEDQVEAAMYMVSEKCLGEVIQLIEQRAGANEKGNIKA